MTVRIAAQIPGGDYMDLADAIECIRPSIVQIAVLPGAAAHGTQLNVLGTGFWVSENGLVMTARQVTEDAQRVMASLPGSRLMVGQGIPRITDPEFTIRGSFNYLGSKVIEEDPRHDIALIQVVQNPFATEQRPFIKALAPDADVYPLLGLATLSTSEVRDGEQIGVSGYPLAEPALVTTSGVIASALEVNIQQAQTLGAPAGYTMPNIADSYLADVTVNPGNSGGPVYRISDGGVIGVCVAFRIGHDSNGPGMFFYNSGLSAVVPIKYGRELIARHG
jgi:S1-C subfamily serine protease